MDGDEPIEPEETLYRLVSRGAYDGTPAEVPPAVFEPKPNDTDGLSLFRAKYITKEEAARRRKGRGICVVAIKAGDLIKAGISIIPDPVGPNGPGPAHALLPQLNYTAINTPGLAALENACADVAKSVGIFPGKASS